MKIMTKQTVPLWNLLGYVRDSVLDLYHVVVERA